MTLDIPNNKEIFRQGDVRETKIEEEKIGFYSCAGANFDPEDPNSDIHSKFNSTGIIIFTAAPTGGDALAAVSLPHGAVITKVQVWGNNTGNTFNLSRSILGVSSGSNIASGNINSETEDISSPIVDNSKYSYFLRVDGLGIGDVINDARITYIL
jgi:hypothetical protein